VIVHKWKAVEEVRSPQRSFLVVLNGGRKIKLKNGASGQINLSFLLKKQWNMDRGSLRVIF
jgi:hypothetical protein